MALSVAPSIYSFLEGRYARQLTDRLLLQSDINNLRNYLGSQQDVNALNIANARTTDLLNARGAYNASLQQGLSPLAAGQNAIGQGGFFAAPVAYNIGLQGLNYAGNTYGYAPITGGAPFAQFTGQPAPAFAGNPSYYGAIGVNPSQQAAIEQYQLSTQLQMQAQQAEQARQLGYQQQLLQLFQPPQQQAAPPPPAQTLTLRQPQLNQLPAVAQSYLPQQSQPTQSKPYAPPTQAAQNPIQPSTSWLSRGRKTTYGNADLTLAP